jgi:hypothetical protein
MQARLNDVMNQVNKAKESVNICNNVTKSPIRKNINKEAKRIDSESKDESQDDFNVKKEIKKLLIVDDKGVNNNNNKVNINSEVMVEIEEVNHLCNDEVDSDLEATLNTWLSSQKKGEIKKNIAAEAKDKSLINSSYFDSKKSNLEIEEEETVVVFKTSLNKEFKDTNNSNDDNGSSEIEEDNDVMELQMFLAKALLEEDVCEAEEIIEEINK